MKKIGFIVDSSCIPKLIKDKNVRLLPVKVNVVDKEGKTKEYDDYTGISLEEIKKSLKNDLNISTSQTPYGLIEETLIEMLREYDRVYCITLAKSFTGLYNSYLAIKKELEKTLDNNRIVVIDTNGLGIDQNYLIDNIKKWEKEGLSVNEIHSKVWEFTTSRCGGVIVKNLKQLIKGGRLTGVKAVLAKTLNLNLLLEWNKGFLTYINKDISFYRAIDKNIDNIQKNIDFKSNGIKKLYFYDDLINRDEAKKAIKYVVEKLGLPSDYPYEVYNLPGTIIAHLGLDSFAFFVVTK